MKEILNKLRADIEANKVQPQAVADLVATLLPRIFSFNHTNDTGYVTGNVLAWWIAEEKIVLKKNLVNLQAAYKLDALHTSLGAVAKIGIRKLGGSALGYIRFDVGSKTPVAEFANDVTVLAGESIEFYVETLPGIAAITVSLPHWLA